MYIADDYLYCACARVATFRAELLSDQCAREVSDALIPYAAQNGRGPAQQRSPADTAKQASVRWRCAAGGVDREKQQRWGRVSACLLELDNLDSPGNGRCVILDSNQSNRTHTSRAHLGSGSSGMSR